MAGSRASQPCQFGGQCCHVGQSRALFDDFDLGIAGNKRVRTGNDFPLGRFVSRDCGQCSFGQYAAFERRGLLSGKRLCDNVARLGPGTRQCRGVDDDLWRPKKTSPKGTTLFRFAHRTFEGQRRKSTVSSVQRLELLRYIALQPVIGGTEVRFIVAQKWRASKILSTERAGFVIQLGRRAGD